MSIEAEKKTNVSYDARFVDGIIALCQKDKGLAARLRRADNPATEYQCWEVLAAFSVDLENNDKRLPFVTIAAAIARSKTESNGRVALGSSIAFCYPDGSKSLPARARLRRLLACDDVPEVCRILRPLLSLTDSRMKGQSLDFIRILKQLRSFPFHTQSIKAQWAQEFFGPMKAPADE